MRNLLADCLWALPFFLDAILSQSLPYNPTTILLPQISSPNKDIAYIFDQGSDSNAQRQLLSLNISSTISALNLSLETISSALPFANDNATAFIPSISSTGEISIYTSSCGTSTSSELWRFTPLNTSTIGNGTWVKQKTNTDSDVTSASIMAGADFLSQGFSFSTLVHRNASQTDIYVFGGMCPKSGANTSTWQSVASYSNHMLRLRPSSNSEYTLGLPNSRGPPIAEAGFTITGLTPTYSNGSGVMTQQQSFVLLGGHTETAFINMSQVAIWSLPEESWGFVTVDSPTGSNANTELAIKSALTSVDSRSGHTSVLAEDGSSIIVYGGWVGDVGQAADPQLAVLSLGTGFGGEGDWKWTIPNNQPSGLGTYGHGAVMLPGNVMMVIGGYNISAPTNSKRDTIVQPMFFNATSMSWASNYINPAYVAALANKDASKSSSISNSKKVGLGVGLGLGLAAIIAALLVWFWYNRRMKRRRDAREKDLNNLSAATAHYYAPRTEANNGWYGNNGDSEGPIHDSTSAVAGYENLNSGVHGMGNNGAYPQPPKQPPRKPLHSRGARGLYQPTPNFDINAGNHGRANSLGTAGPIHPIYETDEEEVSRRNSREVTRGVGIALGEPSMSEAKRHSDPFTDPPTNYSAPLRSSARSVSTSDAESPARSREREIQEWVSDWAAADALLNSQARSHSTAGRLSPTRRAQLIQKGTSVSSVSAEEDGRTTSNLSDGSIAISAVSISRSGSGSQGRSRNNSLRGFITNTMNTFGPNTVTTLAPSTAFSPVFDNLRQQNAPRSAGSTSSSFTTANTSFPALQAEADGLLPRPDELSNGEYSPTRSQPDSFGSPSKTKATGLGKGRAQSGWLGSIRRALVGGLGPGNTGSDFQSVPSRDPSPVRVGGGVEPRRTVSAGATLWRRKQGKSDWEDSAEHEATTRSNTFTGDVSSSSMRLEGGEGTRKSEDDDEWDIERAVQNRVVQVMFTVPKEKLRVVNRTSDDGLSEVGSLRSKKGSGKSLSDVVGMDALVENEVEPERQLDTGSETSSVKSKGKGKSKVLEMVEEMERRSSPEHR